MLAKTSNRRPTLRSCVVRTVQALLLLPALAVAAEHVATVTMLEGNAALLRGVARYALAEGVRLDNGDVLESGDKALVQVEFTDGTLIALGPKTRLMVMSYPKGRGRGGGELFLLSGWLKVERARPEPPVIGKITTPLMEVGIASTAAVMNNTGAEAAMFVETGEAKVAQIGMGGRTEDPVRLKSSQFYSCKREQRCTVAPRPARAFLEGIPRSFTDTLPSRLVKFKERVVAPKRVTDFTYEEVEAWINSTPAVRRAAVNRWRAKASDPAFRSAIAANMREHPEWDRVLYPDKYKDTPGSWGAEPVSEPK